MYRQAVASGGRLPLPEEISSGGMHPTAGLEDAFVSQDEAPDLVVANEGNAAADGNVSLLVGGPGGLHLAETVTDASVPHPNAPALSDVGRLYATTAGVETAFALPLSSSPGDIALPQPVSGPEEVTIPRPLGLFVAPGEEDFTASIEDYLQFKAAFTGELVISEFNGNELSVFDGSFGLLGEVSGPHPLDVTVAAGQDYYVAVSGIADARLAVPYEVGFQMVLQASPAGSPTLTTPDSGAQRAQGFALAPLAGLTVELIPTVQTGSPSSAGAAG